MSGWAAGRPGDPAWDQAFSVWNGRVVRTPALVLRPASASDVAAAIDLARSHRVLLSVKGGGHSLAGTGLADSALTLDMSGLRKVKVDPSTRHALVGSGCLLADVDRATQRHGLATVLGLVSQTGLAGLTLGGGFGYLTRRFGWTVDNLVEVEIVTADRDSYATRSQEPDLFWAVRGWRRQGRRRHPLHLRTASGRSHDHRRPRGLDRAGRAMAAYRELTESAQRELTAAPFVTPIPPDPAVPADRHGQPMDGIFLCHRGTVGANLDPLSRVGPPIIDVLGERPYVEQQGLFDADLPAGLAYDEAASSSLSPTDSSRRSAPTPCRCLDRSVRPWCYTSPVPSATAPRMTGRSATEMRST